jgi:hypothetical protein
MSVFLANYPVSNDNNTAYNRQKLLIQNAIQTYGTDNIAGITVGNEFMLKCVSHLPYHYMEIMLTLWDSTNSYLTDAGASDPNSPTGNQGSFYYYLLYVSWYICSSDWLRDFTGAALLIADIDDTRQMLQSMNLPKNIPVGNSDAGAYFNNLVLGAIDYGVILPPFRFVQGLWCAYFPTLFRIDGQRPSMVRQRVHRRRSRLDMGFLRANGCFCRCWPPQQPGDVHRRDRLAISESLLLGLIAA